MTLTRYQKYLRFQITFKRYKKKSCESKRLLEDIKNLRFYFDTFRKKTK